MRSLLVALLVSVLAGGQSPPPSEAGRGAGTSFNASTGMSGVASASLGGGDWPPASTETSRATSSERMCSPRTGYWPVTLYSLRMVWPLRSRSTVTCRASRSFW